MQLIYGNKVLVCGNNVLNTSESIVLKMTTNRFPQTVNSVNKGTFLLNFNTATTVTINYGNGVSQTYDTTNVNGVNTFSMLDIGSQVVASGRTYELFPYIYPDNTTQERSVTINFTKNFLTAFQLSLLTLDVQDLFFEFAKYPNLTSFNISQISVINNLNLLNASLSSRLSTVLINSSFNSTSPYYNSLPLPILNMPLNNLGIGTLALSTTDFTTSNMNSIVNSAQTLKSLTIQGALFDDSNSGQGALPPNFSGLTGLINMTIASSRHTDIPPVVLTLTGLTLLNFNFNSTVTGLTGINTLTNLTILGTTDSTALTPNIAFSISGLTKLKTWNNQAFGKTVSGNLDIYITNLYNMITSIAPITGTSADQFRNMIFDVRPFSVGDGTEIPSGIFQAPSGYVQGVSNGSPSSSLEMIYVFVTQYNHTWQYRQI